jgi:hypothetical protein
MFLLLCNGWPGCTLELIAGIVGSKKWVPRKMLEIVKTSELQTTARRAIMRRGLVMEPILKRAVLILLEQTRQRLI